RVTWNGMTINSPMLGMVDFSMIPSYFIDEASLYHGASSLGVTGGGLGGAVSLGTRVPEAEGFGLSYTQGIGSYATYDQFLRLTAGRGRWRTSLRAYYATSKNDFPYRNYNKWDFTYDQNHQIIGRERPVERNKNGDFHDFHLLPEFYYQGAGGGRLTLSAWYTNSRRGVPMLNVSYREDDLDKNRQQEQTLRLTAGWDKVLGALKLSAGGGYLNTDLLYHYQSGLGGGMYQDNVRSTSFVQTAYGVFNAEYYRSDRWIFSGNLSLNQHFVRSRDQAKLPTSEDRVIGYDQARSELSALLSARYKPSRRLGLAVNLRQELYADDLSPLMPALFAEYLLSDRGAVVLKASAARNYRYPSLNDLYFMPGGNASLRPERGFTYDGGVEFQAKTQPFTLSGEATFYDSYITDWIVWLPTHKGFWTPRNVKEVHSYGLEVKGAMQADLGRQWNLNLSGNYAITHSINRDDPAGWADESVGKQLPYIPVYSSGVTGTLGWRRWTFTYKWNYYSERFATSSNLASSQVWRISPYYMNDIALEYRPAARWADLSVKVAVNNLFDEEYESVLSRPMPGRNFGLFIQITPRFSKNSL
ncbi:MAG: TonB-dependent receptor, partial [Rikenellaceae bacterium]|nr:TonB-dependent receptor [Rikenellaceae bacterium]